MLKLKGTKFTIISLLIVAITSLVVYHHTGANPNKDTLAGIDRNNDGVRDDVWQYISAKEKSTTGT